MIEICEIRETLQELDNIIYNVESNARNYMRILYSEFLNEKTTTLIDRMRVVARAFIYAGIIDDEFCNKIIRQAEKILDELQEAAAPESLKNT